MNLIRLSTLLPLALGIGLLACDSSKDDDEDTQEDAKVDSDGDGLYDDEDPDPNNVDADGDGIEDGDEVDLGTDPTEVDSDGDGYEDGWEITEGTDPTDKKSVIYTGGWPYNPKKDDIEDPGWDGHASKGEYLPRFKWVDQFGDEVDIYDFAKQGKPMVVDLSGVWCYWCQQMARWMDGKSNAYSDYEGVYEWYTLVPELVANGDIYWVTVLDADASYNAPDQQDAADWYDDYPNDAIPVLVDEKGELTEWMNPSGYPTLMLVEQSTKVSLYSKSDYTKVFDELVDRYGENGTQVE